MTKPLALLCYEKLLPGSQLVNRLEDLGYRVQTTFDARTLSEEAEKSSPMIVVVDLESTREDVCRQIRLVKQNTKTSHVAVLAFGPQADEKLRQAAAEAGADVVAASEAATLHLAQFLERALEVK